MHSSRLNIALVVLSGFAGAGGVIVGCGSEASTSSPATDGGADVTTSDGPIPREGGGDAFSDAGVRDAQLDVLDARPVIYSEASCSDAGPDSGLEAGTCYINCSDSVSCSDGRVRCPPGMPCVVDCSGQVACDQGVECNGATSCDIRCLGQDACQGVFCTGPSCKVTCGIQSCPGKIDCDAGKCDLDCSGDQSCGGAVSCVGAGCTVTCGVQSCGGPVTCEGCTTNCTGGQSCNDVTCTGPSCAINCTGDQTCEKVACSADACAIACPGTQSCSAVTCDGGTCGIGCTGTQACSSGVCCKASTCTIDGGVSNSCP